MPFKGIIPAEEVTLETSFRLKVINFEKYQPETKKLVHYLRLMIPSPLDTLKHEPLRIRGLFFELIRYAGASRRKGYVVLGDNQPLTIPILCDIIGVSIEERVFIVEDIRRLITTDRIILTNSSSDSDLAFSCDDLEISSKNLKNLENTRINPENKQNQNVPLKGDEMKGDEMKETELSLSLFSYFIEKLKPKQRPLFEVWKKKIAARLEKYTLEQLKSCVDNLAYSEWHREKGIQGIDQIVDSDEQVEKWLQRSPSVTQYTEGKREETLGEITERAIREREELEKIYGKGTKEAETIVENFLRPGKSG